VCGQCELFNWLNLIALVNALFGNSAPDQVFGWLPHDAKAPQTVGAADAPPPVHTGYGLAAYGEEQRKEILAHEVGHNLKLWHAPCPSPGQPGAPTKHLDPNWPYGNGKDGRIQEVGFDVADGRTASEDLCDIMGYSYGSSQWISPYHWKKLFDELAPSSTASAASVRGSQSYVLVSGMVSEQGTASIGPLVTVESVADPPGMPTGGAYCLSFHDASDTALTTHCFDLSFENLQEANPAGIAGFAYALPRPAGTVRVKLGHNSGLLAERVASTNAPEVTIQSPAGGEAWDGIQVVSWTGEDRDGDDLTFAVLYSHDGGETWTPVAMELTGSSYRLDTTYLPGSDQVRIRVLASDGFHTAHADSALLAVPAKAPAVLITRPTSEDLLSPYRAVVLSGSAYDPEEGPLSGSALSWWSDRDGLLGRGETVIVPGLTLSRGWHRITLKATDSDQQIGEAHVMVEVTHRTVYLPVILRTH